MNYYTKCVQVAIADPELVSMAEDTNGTFYQSLVRLVEQNGGWQVDVIDYTTRADHVAFHCPPEQTTLIVGKIESLKELYQN